MKIIKKIFIFIVTLAIIVSFIECGKKSHLKKSQLKQNSSNFETNIDQMVKIILFILG